MNGTVPSERSERQQDFRLLIGTEPFDPSDAGTPARRRGAAELSGGREAAREATIVQFAAALTRPDAVRLETAYGLKLDRYIPNLAYLERLPAETIGRLRGDFLVRACIALDPTLKLAPWIADSVQPTAGAPLELTATLFDDADISAVESALGAIGVRDVQIVDDRPIGGRTHARFVLDDLARLAQIADIDDVVWVEPVPVIVSANVEAAQTIQSGTVGTRGSPIWDQGLHGEGQVIGVIDDGAIDIDHCFFADAAPNRHGPGHRKVLKIFNQSDHDPHWHHTFVAAIAAGDDHNKPGNKPNAHPHRGGAWAAKLVCRNRHDMARFGFSFLDMLRTARDAGASIHNISWGDEHSTYTRRARETDAFSWGNEHHVVIAAGNNTGDSGFNTPPGIAKNTLCVAAAKAFPHEMERASGVSGPTLQDKRRKPDLMAVGCVSSALVKTPCATADKPPEAKHLCATSWAAPHAAAAAALVRQYFQEGFYPTGKRQPQFFALTPTGALIKAVLLNSTVDMTGDPGDPSPPQKGYPSDAEGWGLIRLNRALYFDGGPRRLAVKDVVHRVGLESGEYRTHLLFVKSRAQQLKITLVWTDPPPSEYGYRHPSMNVIKLMVEDPAGLKYLSNDFDFRAGVSRPNGAGPQDLLNNVHMVIVNDPPVGRWTITLRADRVTGQDQGFALVASGDLFVGGFFPP